MHLLCVAPSPWWSLTTDQPVKGPAFREHCTGRKVVENGMIGYVIDGYGDEPYDGQWFVEWVGVGVVKDEEIVYAKKPRMAYLADQEKEFCCYCGRWMVYPLIRTSEHIIPKSKGGSDHPKNKRPCCSRCNTWRGNKSLQYWKAEVQELIDLKREYRTFNKQDLETILINIDYIEQAVATATPEMFDANYKTGDIWYS